MNKEEVWVNQSGKIAIYQDGIITEYIWLDYMRFSSYSDIYKKEDSKNLHCKVKDWLKDNEYEFVGYL